MQPLYVMYLAPLLFVCGGTVIKTHYLMEYILYQTWVSSESCNEWMLFVLSVKEFTLSLQLEAWIYEYPYEKVWGFSLFFTPICNFIQKQYNIFDIIDLNVQLCYGEGWRFM